MSDTKDTKDTNTGKPLTLLERMEKLEKKAKSHEDMIDTMFGQVRTSLTTAMEVMDAMVASLGDTLPAGTDLEKKIQNKVEERRQKRMQEIADQEKAQLGEMVKSGQLKMVDTVSEASFMVCRLFNKDGTLVGAGRNQIDFSQLRDNVRSQVLGQSVGFLLEVDGEKMEILEIYEAGTPVEATVAHTEVAPTV